MIVSNCPRCAEPFRVPGQQHQEGLFAECPWCRETFPLSDVLNGLPPVLKVLSADGEPLQMPPQPIAAGQWEDAAAPAARSSFDSPAASDAGVGLADLGSADPVAAGDDMLVPNSAASTETVDDDFGFEETIGNDQAAAPAEPLDAGAWSPEEVDSEPVDFQLQEEVQPAEVSPEPVSAMRVSPAPPRKKKNKGLNAAIGVVLGGLAALPIAGGLLLLLGKAPDLGFWPFDGGASGGGSSRVAAALPKDGATSQPPAGIPLGTGTDLDAAPDPAQQALQQIAPPAGETPSADSQQETEASPIRMPNSDVKLVPIEVDEDASVEAAEVMPASATETEAAEIPPATPEGVADSNELLAAAGRAGEMVDRVSALPPSAADRRRQLGATYKQIAQACDLATAGSPALQALASKIENSTMLGDIESFIGSMWLDSPKRDSDGIALVGRPAAGADGPNITLGNGKQVSITAAESLPSAERVLLLGRIDGDGSSVEMLIAQPLP